MLYQLSYASKNLPAARHKLQNLSQRNSACKQRTCPAGTPRPASPYGTLPLVGVASEFTAKGAQTRAKAWNTSPKLSYRKQRASASQVTRLPLRPSQDYVDQMVVLLPASTWT